MTELLTAAQMRATERAAIDSGAVTGLELMERAGRGVVDAIFEEWPELAQTSHRAVVLCGPGNNGGDGFVVARLLKEWGWQVDVFLYGDPGKLPSDARANYDRWSERGDVQSDDWSLADADIVVDALFGTGLTRPLEGSFKAAVKRLAATRPGGGAARKVSIDMPSGLCSDSGKAIGTAALADLTISTGPLKLGHMIGEGPRHCGRIRMADIGIYPSAGAAGTYPGSLGPVAQCPGPDHAGFLGRLSKAQGDHKYAHGHALVLSGGSGHGGAARLAARGALRIGAGLVTLACPRKALKENAAQLSAIMVRPLREMSDLVETLADARKNAICLGPGLGLDDHTRAQVTAVLAAERATVLDADALTSFADDPATLFDQLHEACVLTPHAGEFARLFPDIAEKLTAPATKGPAYSKVDATRDAAKRAGCTLLFKGPDTVIADQTGRAAISSAHYNRAAPWLATAGSGDVLAGFVAGLLARGFGPVRAAETAAWLHVECARSFGPGLIAEDLPDTLPRVFRQLGL